MAKDHSEKEPKGIEGSNKSGDKAKEPELEEREVSRQYTLPSDASDARTLGCGPR